MSFDAADVSSNAPLQPSLHAMDSEGLFTQGLQYQKAPSNCCVQGHLLQEWTFTSGRYCDVCSLNIPFRSQGLACAECEYDVCSNCIAVTGAGVDFVKSFSCFHAAASLDHAHSQYLVGLCYSKGDGVEQNDVSAFTWMQLSAQQGFALAQLEISRKYEEGIGVEESSAEAFKWMSLAATQGLSRAQNEVGDYYYNGDCVEQSYDEAVKWYRLAAGQSLSTAQTNLGVCYREGDGVNQDFFEAFHWFKLAADQEYPHAQYSVGLCYCNGEGVEMNSHEAFKWFQRAAENADADAEYQHTLGLCYANGVGVDVDLRAAALWFRRSAEQGMEEAEEMIRQLDGIVIVDRQNILPSSLAHFNCMSDKSLSSTDIQIKFKGEEGVDGGGLFNEWMTLLTQQLFCPPLFLPVYEKRCLTRYLRLNPLSMSFFHDPNDCEQLLRLAGVVLGLSVRRNVPLGIDLTPGFCKLLLGEEARFEDLRVELPDEYEWMFDIKETMRQAAAAAQDAQGAADARLHVTEEEYRRGFHTPSRRRQVWECINGLKEARPDAYGDMLKLFEERCLRHSGHPDDDEVSSYVPWQLSSFGDEFVSGSNFDEYVASAVKKQLCTNMQDVIRHIYSSFQATALEIGDSEDEDDEDGEKCEEIPPEELKARLGDISVTQLQAALSGCSYTHIHAACCPN
jgi:TPR repeat protein